MLENLTQRLAKVMKTIRGEARLTESNVADALREVRVALLEADVALPVVRDFIARVKEKALGEEVVGSLTPGQALVGVVASVAGLDAPYRELSMLALALASWRLTAPELRRENRFGFHPILEVAVVFAGVFATMVPALDILRAEAPALGIREPWHFFWATGALSSFLDNAPTYLVFLAVARGAGLAPEVAGVSHAVLVGISLGAVFMGANTYIGNGPNFMVRSIAEERGVPMPSFGGYMLVSGAVLLPLFALVTLVFLV